MRLWSLFDTVVANQRLYIGSMNLHPSWKHVNRYQHPIKSQRASDWLTRKTDLSQRDTVVADQTLDTVEINACAVHLIRS